jgi:hypothetical protein
VKGEILHAPHRPPATRPQRWRTSSFLAEHAAMAKRINRNEPQPALWLRAPNPGVGRRWESRVSRWGRPAPCAHPLADAAGAVSLPALTQQQRSACRRSAVRDARRDAWRDAQRDAQRCAQRTGDGRSRLLPRPRPLPCALWLGVQPAAPYSCCKGLPLAASSTAGRCGTGHAARYLLHQRWLCAALSLSHPGRPAPWTPTRSPHAPQLSNKQICLPIPHVTLTSGRITCTQLRTPYPVCRLGKCSPESGETPGLEACHSSPKPNPGKIWKPPHEPSPSGRFLLPSAPSLCCSMYHMLYPQSSGQGE